MSYNSSTKTITAPVSIQDVQQALNVDDKDLKELCTSSAINKWARYKPVHYGELFSNNDGKGVVDMEYQSAKKVCGLTIPVVPVGKLPSYSANPGEFLNYYANNNWEYTEKPTGGLTSPYRLTDFDGYHHVAIPPFSTGLIKDTITDFNISSGAFSVNLREGEIDNTVITALQNNTNLKPAIAFYACNNTSNRWNMSNWELKYYRTLTDAINWAYVSLEIQDLKNNNVNLVDGGYYAMVIYMNDNSQNVSFLLPWDNNNYFAAVYHAEVLSYFEIKDYIHLTREPGGHVQYTFSTGYSYSTSPASMPTTFYIYLPIVYVREGYHDLNRDLVFGPGLDSQDQLKIIINGNSSYVYKGVPVNSSGVETTVTLARQSDSQSILFKFAGVPASVWQFGAGIPQTNTISIITSHDYGRTWQGTATPDFTGRLTFKDNL